MASIWLKIMFGSSQNPPARKSERKLLCEHSVHSSLPHTLHRHEERFWTLTTSDPQGVSGAVSAHGIPEGCHVLCGLECPQPSSRARHNGTRILTQRSVEGASGGLGRPRNCLQTAGFRPVNLSVAQTPKVKELPSVVGAGVGVGRENPVTWKLTTCRDLTLALIIPNAESGMSGNETRVSIFT